MDDKAFEQAHGFSRAELERARRDENERSGNLWDKLPLPIKVLAAIFGALYFVALPLWTLINAPL